MLNDIRQHVCADEQRQCELESEFAKNLRIREKNNLDAFSRFIPSIAQAIVRFNNERLSVFVDKAAQANIVNISTGLALYDMPVDDNIALQVQDWPSHCAMLRLQDISNNVTLASDTPILVDDTFDATLSYTQSVAQKCAENTPDTLVVLGLGKAEFLPSLLKQIPAKQVVIYEPDWEIFKCSFMLFDWAHMLEEADKQNIQLFMQIGPNIQKIFDEINELSSVLGSKNFIFYRHILNDTNNNILKNIRCGRWNKEVIQSPSTATIQQKNNTKFTEINAKEHHQHCLRFINCLPTTTLQNVSNERPLFDKNMALFSDVYPDIYQAFVDYQPRCWEALANVYSGEINLFNRQHQSFFAGASPQEEGQLQAKYFASQPNLDGLVFGYEGEKLKHFLHNRFTRKADLLLKRQNLDKTELPQSVKVLLIFGLGSGYMLEALFETHDIQNLCICEPNADFFYAALHAIDWQPIFDKFNENDGKLYINIGESSSMLFKDLNRQFVGIGPHLLNETYIMQAYENPLLANGLKEVRQQLQVIFSMGENVDHVMYSIAHSSQAIKDKVPILRAQAKQKLSISHRQQAIFIVGNGPSLDESIEVLKEYADQAIIVSCGTALQSLHRNGIRPDFHAEVEQNRANYDWACRINDFDYLKQISLLSICGVHPDTYNLYKDVYLCFKVGESSTQAITSMLPNDDFEYLEYAYPTVTNFAASLFLSMGFEQIYLHGVDLGFVDLENHHSKSSAYYENGKQVYWHKKLFAGSITTKGNRSPWVNTKTEFNISRMIFEQSLAQYKADCFNLSNGAHIAGSIPLLPEDTLIVNTPEQKHNTLERFFSCFASIECDIEKQFNRAYSQKLMQSQLEQLTAICQQALKQKLTEKEQINTLITKLRRHMIEARQIGGSLFFYYMFNSVNYLCAVLSRALMFPDEQSSLDNCQAILSDWNVLLTDFTSLMQHQFSLKDTAECHSNKHELNKLKSEPVPVKVLYYTSSHIYQQQCITYSNNQNVKIIVPTVELDISNEAFLYIDILNADEIPSVLSKLKKSNMANESVNRLCFVFHDYRHLLKMRSMCVNTHFTDACFMYLSLLWQSDIASHPLLVRVCNSGYQDYLCRQQYFDFLCARAKDIPNFSTIMFKPVLAERSMYLPAFSDKDATQAYAQYINQIKENIQFIENISNFNHLYDVDFIFIQPNDGVLLNNEANGDTASHIKQEALAQQQARLLESFEIDKPPNWVRDEYQAHASYVIDNKLSQHIDFETCYSFKCYCAVMRNNHESQTNTDITLLDYSGNRGILVNRKLFNFELQVRWRLN